MSTAPEAQRTLCIGVTYDMERYEAEGFGKFHHRHPISAKAYSSVMGLILRDNLGGDNTDRIIKEQEAEFKVFLREFDVVEHRKVRSAYEADDAEPTHDAWLGDCLPANDTEKPLRYAIQMEAHDGSADSYVWHRYFTKEDADKYVDDAIDANFPISFVSAATVMTDLQRALLAAGKRAGKEGRNQSEDPMVRIIGAKLSRVARMVVEAGYSFRWEPVFFDYEKPDVHDFLCVDIKHYVVTKKESRTPIADACNAAAAGKE